MNIGPTLASKIENTDIDPTDYVESINNTSTVFLEPVDKDEIGRIIKALKNSSPGWDSIGSAVVKNTCHHFVEPLTHLFNASLVQGVIPTVLKKAKVIPIFKGVDPSQLSSYRSVSVLPCFSKILERLMYNRL